jgi:hypothetical protein
MRECRTIRRRTGSCYQAKRGGQAGTKLGTLFRVIAALDLDVQIAPRSKGGADLTEIF